jgi:hypothetical protein
MLQKIILEKGVKFYFPGERNKVMIRLDDLHMNVNGYKKYVKLFFAE